MLEVENLTIRVGREVLVKSLSLTLPRNAITCLIGPSGCGKSSVVKWLAGVLAPELDVTGTATARLVRTLGGSEQ